MKTPRPLAHQHRSRCGSGLATACVLVYSLALLASPTLADVWLKNQTTKPITGTVNGKTYTFAPGETKRISDDMTAVHLVRRTRALITTAPPPEAYSQTERDTVATMDLTQLQQLVASLLDSDHASAHDLIRAQAPTQETAQTETPVVGE